MIRSVALGLALALGLAAWSSPAAAAPVVQVVTVKVNPGMLDQYLAETKKLQGVLARLESKGTMRVWNTTQGGTDTGTVLVGVEYPDMAAWAADSPRIQADAEWKKIVAGLATVRTVMSSAIWRDISPSASTSGPGKVLVLTGVEVKPGQLEEYKERVGSARAINERLGLTGRLRMWRAELAGPEAGAVAVGIEYPDVASYVAEQDKLSADSEWQTLLSSLDAVRTPAGRWMYQEITP
jgi:hypothetical protein